jgi:hypothetical protein
MLQLISNIGKISATIRKVADTLKVGADAFDVLKRLNSIWNGTKETKTETKENETND